MLIDSSQSPGVVIKQDLDDWIVHEDLGVNLTNSGEHAYFHIEKRGLNTADVARQLADCLGLRWSDVGFAGRKDKQGITRQWLSAPTNQQHWPVDNANIECLEIRRHTHKLRPGNHRGNYFQLRLRASSAADHEKIVECAERLGQTGFANLFGPQRVSPDNLAQAKAWLLAESQRSDQSDRSTAGGPRRRRSRRQKGQRRIGSGKRGWHLSVLRSYLFNEVTRQRHAEYPPGRIMDGDVLCDGFPSAPLWGRGRSATRGPAALLEEGALANHAPLCDALEFTGLNQARRAMFVRAQEFSVSRETDASCVLHCWLPPGVYATAMLAASFQVHDQSLPGSM